MRLNKNRKFTNTSTELENEFCKAQTHNQVSLFSIVVNWEPEIKYGFLPKELFSVPEVINFHT